METPNTTDKQLDLLLFLYKFYYLNTNQVQKLLKHKNPQGIQVWLQDLVKKGYITYRDFNRKKFINNTRPAIYTLTKVARKKLKKNPKCELTILNRVYQEKKRSDIFRSHWLFMADLYFSFLEVAQKQNLKLNFYTSTDLADFAYTPLPLPDAYITVTEHQKSIKRYFLNCFDEKKPRFVMRNRIAAYCRYYKGSYWQEHVKHPFPKILIICPNTFTKIYLSRFIIKTIKVEKVEIEFFLALKTDIQNEGIQEDTWD